MNAKTRTHPVTNASCQDFITSEVFGRMRSVLTTAVRLSYTAVVIYFLDLGESGGVWELRKDIIHSYYTVILFITLEDHLTA